MTTPDRPTLLLRDDEVRRCVDLPAVIDAVAAALGAAGPAAAAPARTDLAVPGTFFRVLPAILTEPGVLGLKMLHGSFERGVRYLLVLCDLDTGATLAVLDAAHLTAVRTGAVSGVATRLLARPDASTVGVIGAGAEAETNLAAVAAVRPISAARVFSPRPARRTAFAERMSAELGIAITPADTAAAAVTGADVVVAATNTGPGGPVALRGEWLEPGQHVVSIGSTTPAVRELDATVLTRADRVVFDVPADADAGRSADVRAWRDLDPAAVAAVPTLTDLLTGAAPGRRRASDITVFKSVGAAVQDLAAAVAVHRTARDRAVGTEVPALTTLRTF
jgi:alanine dehydrogenase